MTRSSAVAMVAVVLSAVGPLASEASASHFRAGNLSWQRAGTGNDVTFQNTQAWRRDSFAGSGTDGYPVTGDIIDNSEGCIEFGDALVDCPKYQVTFTNVADNYIVIRALAGVTAGNFNFAHSYGSGGPFTALTQSCCTIGALNNAASANWNVSALVDLNRDSQSPRSSVPPIVNLPSGGEQRFTIPATDAGGQTLRFRLSTPSESCVDCTDPHPPGLSIDPTSGQVAWDTTGRDGLWWTGVVIEALNGGDVVSSSQVQYLIRVGGGGSNNPPVWNPPTPEDGTTFEVVPGQTLALDLQASDPDGADLVQIFQNDGPGNTVATDGNPGIARYTFTAAPEDLGKESIIQFIAQDNGAPPLGPPFRSFSVKVVSPSAPPPPPTTTPRGDPDPSLTVNGASTDLVGDVHTVSLAARRGPAALANTPVVWRVEGANPTAGRVTTDGGGNGAISWTGDKAGRDTLTAFLDLNGNSVRDALEPEATHAVDWLALPVVMKTANVEPVSGQVFVKLPGGANARKWRLGSAGANGFIPLTEARTIPLGSTLDTAKGRVELRTATGTSKPGQTSNGQFYDGLFTLRQTGGNRTPITEMGMVGRLTCRSGRPGKVQTAASRSRRLWGNARGRFRTRGRNSSATVRGTQWLTKDSCNSTTTTVKSGVVVVRDFARRRNITLKAGKSYIARPKPAKKK